MSIVTATTTAALLLNGNRLRKSFVIQNEDASDVVYIKKEDGTALTVSATDHDHRIGPGAVLSLNSTLDGKEQIQGRYTVIAGANTPVVSVFETEDDRR